MLGFISSVSNLLSFDSLISFTATRGYFSLPESIKAVSVILGLVVMDL